MRNPYVIVVKLLKVDFQSIIESIRLFFTIVDLDVYTLQIT